MMRADRALDGVSVQRSTRESGSMLTARALELLVDADRALEHRVGLAALVADRLEHAGGERIELALDGRLGAELGVLQQCDEQQCDGRQRGADRLLVARTGVEDVSRQPGDDEADAEGEEERRAGEVGRALGDPIEQAAAFGLAPLDGVFEATSPPA